jgi:ABC-type phosphate/phosphonate transport system substrate-binding protein
VVWYLFDNRLRQPDEKLIENAMADYLKDKINTTVNIVMPTDYDTTVENGHHPLATKIDLMFSLSWLTNYVEIAREGWACGSLPTKCWQPTLPTRSRCSVVPS